LTDIDQTKHTYNQEDHRNLNSNALKTTDVFNTKLKESIIWFRGPLSHLAKKQIFTQLQQHMVQESWKGSGETISFICDEALVCFSVLVTMSAQPPCRGPQPVCANRCPGGYKYKDDGFRPTTVNSRRGNSTAPTRWRASALLQSRLPWRRDGGC